jgi:hypothetical protein
MAKPAALKHKAKSQKNTTTTEEQTPNTNIVGLTTQAPPPSSQSESSIIDQDAAPTQPIDNLTQPAAVPMEITAAHPLFAQADAENINSTAPAMDQQDQPIPPPNPITLMTGPAAPAPPTDWINIPAITNPHVLAEIERLWEPTSTDFAVPPDLSDEQLQSYMQANIDWVDMSRFVDVPLARITRPGMQL